MSGASGSRHEPSSIPGPEPLGPIIFRGADAVTYEHRSEPFRTAHTMPHARSRVPKRVTIRAKAVTSSRPRAAEKRPSRPLIPSRLALLPLIRSCHDQRVLFIFVGIVCDAPVAKLWAGDDTFNQNTEATAPGRQSRAHVAQDLVVRRNECASGVRRPKASRIGYR